MNKKVFILALVILLIIGGVAFADQTDGLFTSDAENGDDVGNGENDENGNGDDGDDNGNTNGDNEEGSDENGENEDENGDENGDPDDEEADERSEVAKAVHSVLTGDADLEPGDEGFGQAVSERAKDPDIHLGQEVSQAARAANGSLDKSNGNNGNSGNNGNGNGSVNASANRGNGNGNGR
ncbi:MAG: hypothetical protein SCJ97_04655 [Bacillota bacterium]|nr:hypothetical protein [Bacillota bacterium]